MGCLAMDDVKYFESKDWLLVGGGTIEELLGSFSRDFGIVLFDNKYLSSGNINYDI